MEITMADAGTESPASVDDEDVASGETASAVEEPTGVESTTSPDGNIVASIEEPASEDAQSSEVPPTSVATEGAAASQNSQTAAIQSQQDTLAAATLQIVATDLAPAPVVPRNSAKTIDMAVTQSSIEQSASASSPSSYFTALQTAQPNLQKWLDNWLGPGARATISAREASKPSAQPSATENIQAPSLQDNPIPDLPSDAPEAPLSELLAPEEIAQRYDEIQLWLDANPGTEQGIAASFPERSLFSYAAVGLAANAGHILVPGFGQTPGLAALDGYSFATLRGVSAGYAALRVI